MPVDDVVWAVTDLAERTPTYRTYRAYYYGDHRQMFDATKWRSYFGDMFRQLRDNVCPSVVHALTDRLQVAGFQGSGGVGTTEVDDDTLDLAGAESDDVATAADMIWRLSRMDARADTVHREAAREGDSYVLVWPDANNRDRLWPHSPTMMTVRWSIDPPTQVEYGAKLWRLDDGRHRVNVYYRDRVERYVTTGTPSEDERKKGTAPQDDKRWTEWTEAEDGTAPTLPHGYGRVPISPFPNDAEPGQHGRSELADVIPLQDALNKALADLLVAMEFQALPQRWATGVEEPTDENGQPIPPGDPRSPFTRDPEGVWTVGATDAAFGQFAAAQLGQFLDVQDNIRTQIARVAGIPLYYFLMAGQVPSGEALRVSESRLVAKARARQAAWGNAWEDAISLAVGVPVEEVSTLWVPAETSIEREQAETALIKRDLGVTKRQALRELGYDEPTIDEMLSETADETGAVDALEGMV